MGLLKTFIETSKCVIYVRDEHWSVLVVVWLKLNPNSRSQFLVSKTNIGRFFGLSDGVCGFSV